MLQYIKDTRGELRHVAWPTQTQTIVYTVLVIAISAFAAAYLGLFDYLFTSGLETVLGILPETTPTPALDVNTSVPLGGDVTITQESAGDVPVAPETTLQIVPQAE